MIEVLPHPSTFPPNVLKCDFTPQFRAHVINAVISIGAYRTRISMLEHGYHPSFVDVLIRRIRTGGMGNG